MSILATSPEGENLREPLFNGKGKFSRDSKPQAGAIWPVRSHLRRGKGLHFQRSLLLERDAKSLGHMLFALSHLYPFVHVRSCAVFQLVRSQGAPLPQWFLLREIPAGRAGCAVACLLQAAVSVDCKPEDCKSYLKTWWNNGGATFVGAAPDSD